MERLNRARLSADLGDSPYEVGDIDWIRAAGMVAQEHSIALAVWRLLDNGRGAITEPVLHGLLKLSAGMGHAAPIATADKVLGYLLDPICAPCGGRGALLIERAAKPTLSDECCKGCSGTGKSRPDFTGDEAALFGRLKAMQAAAAAAIKAKMG